MPKHKTMKPYRSAAPAEVVLVPVSAVAALIGLGRCTE